MTPEKTRETVTPTRRERRAADAALRAHNRCRDRIDRYARSTALPPGVGLADRAPATVLLRVDA